MTLRPIKWDAFTVFAARKTDMSKRRQQTNKPNAVQYLLCNTAMPHNIYLFKKKYTKCKCFEKRAFIHIDTIVWYYINATIGTTSSCLKCHFSENSINPKQVQTLLLIFIFIRCAIYLLASNHPFVFQTGLWLCRIRLFGVFKMSN